MIEYDFTRPELYQISPSEQVYFERILHYDPFERMFLPDIPDASIGYKLARRIVRARSQSEPSDVTEISRPINGYFREFIWHTDRYYKGNNLATFSSSTGTTFATMRMSFDPDKIPRRGELRFLKSLLELYESGACNDKWFAHDLTEEIMRKEFGLHWVTDWDEIKRREKIDGIDIHDLEIQQLLPYVVAFNRQAKFLHTSSLHNPSSPTIRLFGRMVTDLEVADLAEGDAI